MNPDQLTHTGKVLYGPCWKRALARALDVNEGTVSRWASGKRRIPDTLGNDIDRLVAERRRELERLSAKGG